MRARTDRQTEWQTDTHAWTHTRTHRREWPIHIPRHLRLMRNIMINWTQKFNPLNFCSIKLLTSFPSSICPDLAKTVWLIVSTISIQPIFKQGPFDNDWYTGGGYIWYSKKGFGGWHPPQWAPHPVLHLLYQVQHLISKRQHSTVTRSTETQHTSTMARLTSAAIWRIGMRSRFMSINHFPYLPILVTNPENNPCIQPAIRIATKI